MGAPINLALSSPKEELSFEEDGGKFDTWDVEDGQLHWGVKELDESQFEVTRGGGEITSKEEKYVDFWEVKGDFSLNLSLNYQEVMDAWSNRGSLWTPANVDACSVGEMTMVLEEERERRRASVLKYKEKRQSRLFSKKIRYEVRKLNAESRPRFKGRFVKRGPDS